MLMLQYSDSEECIQFLDDLKRQLTNTPDNPSLKLTAEELCTIRTEALEKLGMHQKALDDMQDFETAAGTEVVLNEHWHIRRLSCLKAVKDLQVDHTQ